MYRATGNRLSSDEYWAEQVIHTVQVQIVTGLHISSMAIEEEVNVALDNRNTPWIIGSAVVLQSELVKD